MKKILFIVNPVAGKKKILNALEEIDKAFYEGGCECDIYFTKKRGDATDKVISSAEKYDMVLSTILNFDNSLHNILLSGNSYVGDSSKYVMISIQIPQKHFDYSLGWKYRGSNVISEETYTTESEIDVQIVISSLDYAVAHFIHDGVKYSFTAFKSSFGGNMDDCVEMLKTLVESLE